jgi:hypothetical protein
MQIGEDLVAALAKKADAGRRLGQVIAWTEGPAPRLYPPQHGDDVEPWRCAHQDNVQLCDLGMRSTTAVQLRSPISHSECRLASIIHVRAPV